MTQIPDLPRLGRRAALSLPALLWAGPGRGGPDEPKRGGTLVYAIAAEPPTYDLAATSTFAVMHRLAPHYSTLLQYEPGNYPNIVGDLAESWTAAPDGLTYTLQAARRRGVPRRRAVRRRRHQGDL